MYMFNNGENENKSLSQIARLSLFTNHQHNDAPTHSSFVPLYLFFRFDRLPSCQIVACLAILAFNQSDIKQSWSDFLLVVLCFVCSRSLSIC